MPPASFLRELISRWREEHRLVLEEADGVNLRRVRFLGSTVAVLNLLHIVGLILVQPVEGASTAIQQWHVGLLITHAMMGLVMVVGALTAARLLRQPHRRRTIRAIGYLGALSGLLMATLITAVDQWVTPNMIPFVVSTLAVSAVILMDPRGALAILLINYVVFFVLVGQTQDDPYHLLSNRLAGFGNTVVAWGLAVILWRSFTTITLQRRAIEEARDALRQHNEELRDISRRDDLTRLLNRQAVLDHADQLLSRDRRARGPLSILLLDLDHFKSINDTWGHPAGDQVLRIFADRLRENVRASDVIGRMGGEEFIAVLPHTDASAAAVVAEKLRVACAAEPVRWTEAKIPLSVSIGVCTAAADTRTSVALLYAAADRALYDAKRSGRDQIAIAESPESAAMV